VNNDNDGKTDSNDPGWSSATDNDEVDLVVEPGCEGGQPEANSQRDPDSSESIGDTSNARPRAATWRHSTFSPNSTPLELAMAMAVVTRRGRDSVLTAVRSVAQILSAQ